MSKKAMTTRANDFRLVCSYFHWRLMCFPNSIDDCFLKLSFSSLCWLILIETDQDITDLHISKPSPSEIPIENECIWIKTMVTATCDTSASGDRVPRHIRPLNRSFSTHGCTSMQISFRFMPPDEQQ